MTLAPMNPSMLSCRSPLAVALGEGEAREIASIFKALGDPTRVRLLSLIAGSPGGEACVCDLTEPVGLAQPTVSHHLKTLVDAGLLAREQRGRWAYYAITPAPLETLATHVESITRRPLPGD